MYPQSDSGTSYKGAIIAFSGPSKPIAVRLHLRDILRICLHTYADAMRPALRVNYISGICERPWSPGSRFARHGGHSFFASKTSISPGSLKEPRREFSTTSDGWASIGMRDLTSGEPTALIARASGWIFSQPRSKNSKTGFIPARAPEVICVASHLRHTALKRKVRLTLGSVAKNKGTQRGLRGQPRCVFLWPQEMSFSRIS